MVCASRPATFDQLVTTRIGQLLSEPLRLFDIQLLPNQIAALLRDELPGSADDEAQLLVLSVPAELRRSDFGIRMLIDGTASPVRAVRPDPKLIKLIVRAHLPPIGREQQRTSRRYRAR